MGRGPQHPAVRSRAHAKKEDTQEPHHKDSTQCEHTSLRKMAMVDGIHLDGLLLVSPTGAPPTDCYSKQILAAAAPAAAAASAPAVAELPSSARASKLPNTPVGRSGSPMGARMASFENIDFLARLALAEERDLEALER